MTWTSCSVCQGMISADDSICRICRTPVPGRHDPWQGPPPAPAPIPPVAPPPQALPEWPTAAGPGPTPPSQWAPPEAAPPPASPPDWPPPPPPAAAPAPPGYAPLPPPGTGAPAGYAPPTAPYPGAPAPGWGPGVPPGPNGPAGPAGPGSWNLPAGFAPGPAGWAPPAPPPPKRNRAVIAVAAACVVVVLLCGVVIWRARPGGPEYPEQWDSRVLDAVQFVEQDKGEPFLHPVYVDFLSEDEFRAHVESAPASVTDEDRAYADQQEAMLRALGLLEGDVDLLAEQDTVTGGGTAALYDPVTKRVSVRGTELTPDIEGTVVHELTHAWQDQHYDLTRLQDFDTDAQATAFRMIAEGDAVMTEDDWLDTLSTSQRDSYDELTQAASDQAGDELANVPAVLVASFGAPYEFGQPFLEGLEAVEGSDYLDTAFADPPSTDEQIMNPEAYLDGEGAIDVATPDTGDDEVLEADTFGALFWYLTLAERIDPLVALHAIDGWGGDAYAVFDHDGTVCVASRVVGDDADATAELGSALTEWGSTLPDVTVDVATDQVDVRACDPGPEATFDYVGRATDVIAYPVIRLIIWSQGVVQGEEPERATCYSNAFVDQLTLDDLGGGPLSDERVLALHQGAATECPG